MHLDLSTLILTDPGWAQGRPCPPRPVKIVIKKMTVECSSLYFMLISPPSQNILDPLLVFKTRSQGLMAHLIYLTISFAIGELFPVGPLPEPRDDPLHRVPSLCQEDICCLGVPSLSQEGIYSLGAPSLVPPGSICPVGSGRGHPGS